MSLSRIIARGFNRYTGKGGLFADPGAPISYRQFDQFIPSDPVNILSAGSARLLGPAEGYLRVFDSIVLTSLGATPAIDFSLNVPDDVDSPYYLARGQSLGAATAASAPPTAFSIRSCPIGFGESLDIDNVGTATCTLWYSYFDFPNTNRFLVRKKFSNTLVTLIPAAPANYFNKTLNLGFIGSNFPAGVVYNDDTVAVQASIYSDLDLIARGTSTAAGVTMLLPGCINAPGATVTTKSRGIASAVAVTTRPAVAIFCYEQIPIQAGLVG